MTWSHVNSCIPSIHFDGHMRTAKRQSVLKKIMQVSILEGNWFITGTVVYDRCGCSNLDYEKVQFSLWVCLGSLSKGCLNNRMFSDLVMRCMLSTFHVSLRMVANISESYLPLPQYPFGIGGGKYDQKIIMPIFCSSVFLFQVAFIIFFYRHLFSLFSARLFVITVRDYILAKESVKWYIYCKLV